MRRPACTALLPIAAALALASCGSSDDGARSTPSASAPTTASTPTTASVPAPPPGPKRCRRGRAPQPRLATRVPRPRVKLDPAKAYSAEVQTSCGSFVIALDVRQAPTTTASFVWLARRGFYDGLAFHRVAPGFVIQGGDPRGDGSGGPGYSVTEPPPASVRYTRGTVAMAKTETEAPGTSGSQFFIVTAPDASAEPYSLPADYAVVGRVANGLDAVRRIAAVKVDEQTDQPVRPVVIRRLKIRAT